MRRHSISHHPALFDDGGYGSGSETRTNNYSGNMSSSNSYSNSNRFSPTGRWPSLREHSEAGDTGGGSFSRSPAVCAGGGNAFTSVLPPPGLSSAYRSLGTSSSGEFDAGTRREPAPWELADWSMDRSTDTLFTTTPSHRPATTNYEQQPIYAPRFPAHHRAEQLSQTSFWQPSQTELSPDPESAFYTTRKRLLQQHRAAVPAVSWEESDDDGSSLPRRSSTSDLAALDNGFEDGNAGGGSSAPAFDERGLMDSSYGREARNQYPPSQLSQPSLHRRAFSSTIPRSLIPPRETTATTTTSRPWADHHPDYIDSFATSASASFRTQSRTVTSRTTTSWSDAATKFMETRPGDFGPVPTAGDLVQGISAIHLGPPGHGFHHQQQQHHHHQQQQGYQVGGSASAAVLDPKTLRQAMDFAAARGINPRNFETRPINSSYFVIKSNSTFNILASLAHNVWASTELGNRRLHAAFHAASQNNNNSETDVNGGSVYLFFSVTSSGRFCGVARMASGVDWDHVEAIWEGGKRYKGTFELQWIFVKDVPNAAVRHLKVSTNENKPVSNSRDTQQVVEEIGHDMLRIFSQTSCMGHSALYDLFADPSELATTTITTGTATTGDNSDDRR